MSAKLKLVEDKPPTPRQKSQAVKKQNRLMLKAAVDVAKKMKATTLFVYVDALDESLLPTK